MDVTLQSQLVNLVQGRRLLIYASQKTAGRENSAQKIQSAREMMEEDIALLQGETHSTQIFSGQSQASTGENVRIQLADLSQKIKSVQTGEGDQGVASQQITVSQSVEETLEIRYSHPAPVAGLIRISGQNAETDRYVYKFENGTTFTILDKWSGKSTTIWGDPHVDVSDLPGNTDGEFKDLKNSDTLTTLMLKDGARVTITAPDSGLIQQVDIYKDGQHLRGIGAGSPEWNENEAFFAHPVDSASGSEQMMGDVVYAGGDGTDWYDGSGYLIWGKVTGREVQSRPASLLTISYQRTETSQVIISQVNQII